MRALLYIGFCLNLSRLCRNTLMIAPCHAACPTSYNFGSACDAAACGPICGNASLTTLTCTAGTCSAIELLAPCCRAVAPCPALTHEA